MEIGNPPTPPIINKTITKIKESEQRNFIGTVIPNKPLILPIHQQSVNMTTKNPNHQITKPFKELALLSKLDALTATIHFHKNIKYDSLPFNHSTQPLTNFQYPVNTETQPPLQISNHSTQYFDKNHIMELPIIDNTTSTLIQKELLRRYILQTLKDNKISLRFNYHQKVSANIIFDTQIIKFLHYIGIFNVSNLKPELTQHKHITYIQPQNAKSTLQTKLDTDKHVHFATKPHIIQDPIQTLETIDETLENSPETEVKVHVNPGTKRKMNTASFIERSVNKHYPKDNVTSHNSDIPPKTQPTKPNTKSTRQPTHKHEFKTFMISVKLVVLLGTIFFLIKAANAGKETFTRSSFVYEYLGTSSINNPSYFVMKTYTPCDAALLLQNVRKLSEQQKKICNVKLKTELDDDKDIEERRHNLILLKGKYIVINKFEAY